MPMCKHEEKKCPRCNVIFECKPGNVGQCQCGEVALTIKQRADIAEQFTDCLCVGCLKELATIDMINS